MKRDDPLAAVAALLAEAEAKGRTTVRLPTALARQLFDRAAKTGRPPISPGSRRREWGWIAAARIRREKLIADGMPSKQASDLVAKELKAKFDAGTRKLSLSYIRDDMLGRRSRR